MWIYEPVCLSYNYVCACLWCSIMKVWWNKRRGHNNQLSEAYTRWEQDYDLEPYTRLSLFNEYLEMGEPPLCSLMSFTCNVLSFKAKLSHKQRLLITSTYIGCHWSIVFLDSHTCI